MAHRFDEANEFPFVRRQLGVVWRNGATEECQWISALVKYRAKAGAGGIAVDDEWLVEIW
jgi:hypothetical protein